VVKDDHRHFGELQFPCGEQPPSCSLECPRPARTSRPVPVISSPRYGGIGGRALSLHATL
jgi:hypothetical protein